VMAAALLAFVLPIVRQLLRRRRAGPKPA
jgi:hypothetical protein